jgi:hypothetical protein
MSLSSGSFRRCKNPQTTPRLCFCSKELTLAYYVVAAVVIYYYGGKDVKSPALSSTDPITAKIAYGIAIPTVCLPLAKSTLE